MIRPSPDHPFSSCLQADPGDGRISRLDVGASRRLRAVNGVPEIEAEDVERLIKH